MALVLLSHLAWHLVRSKTVTGCHLKLGGLLFIKGDYTKIYAEANSIEYGFDGTGEVRIIRKGANKFSRNDRQLNRRDGLLGILH